MPYLRRISPIRASLEPLFGVLKRHLMAFTVILSWLVAVGCTSSEETIGRKAPSAPTEYETTGTVPKATPAANSDAMNGAKSDSATSYRTHSLVGYYAYWMKGAWIDMDLRVYDRIVFFTTTPGSDGRMQARNGWPHAWVGLLTRADSLDIPVVPALALLEPDSIKSLFSSHDAISNLLETSLLLIEESKGMGVHLDIELFESVTDSLRDNFISFTDSLAEQALRRWPDAMLSMFTPAFDNDGLYDLSRIHEGYKQLMVQGYDLHWQTGPQSGPVSALKGWGGANWESIVDRYRNEGLDDSRLVMTIPYYGYEWPVESDSVGSSTKGTAKITTFAAVDSLVLPQYRINIQSRINQHGLQRDSVSGSPFYSFSDSSGFWQGWFEDTHSLEQKYSFIKEAGLKGVATFPMGYDQGILDAHMNGYFGPKRKK